MKVLLEGLSLYQSHGKCFVSLNENGTEPGIIIFLKVHAEVQIPVGLASIRKNSKENNSCTSWNFKINSMDCTPKLSIDEKQRV